MEQFYKNSLYVLLGWVAGIIAPIIVEKNKEEAKKNSYKIAISSDLKNLAIRLVSTYMKIQRLEGLYDKVGLQKIRKTYEKYATAYDSHMVGMIDDLLRKMDESNIDKMQLEKNEFDALGLKKFSLPFIQFNQDSLLFFDEKYQRNVLEILSQINILNEEVEAAMEFYHKTFDSSCMDKNEEIVRGNLSSSYSNIQRGCNYILDKIDHVLLFRM